MIEFTKAFKTSTGQTFATLEQAQRHEIDALLFADADEESREADGTLLPSLNRFIDRIMEHRAALVDILTTTQTSKPRARSINGGKKPRKAKPAAVTEATNAGNATAMPTAP